MTRYTLSEPVPIAANAYHTKERANSRGASSREAAESCSVCMRCCEATGTYRVPRFVRADCERIASVRTNVADPLRDSSRCKLGHEFVARAMVVLVFLIVRGSSYGRFVVSHVSWLELKSFCVSYGSWLELWSVFVLIVSWLEL